MWNIACLLTERIKSTNAAFVQNNIQLESNIYVMSIWLYAHLDDKTMIAVFPKRGSLS